MTGSLTAELPPDWREALADELEKPYWRGLEQTLTAAAKRGKVVYPPTPQIFAALRLTPLASVKAVILGQDPYHGPGQAMGLSFSVPQGERLPPSLRNIFKELAADLHVPPPTHGDLSSWARQGVLLLNAVLTVEAGVAGSHAGIGWESLTRALVEVLNRRRQHLVFVLWGNQAQRLAPLIDPAQHLVLCSAHPSPLSAYHGFWGSRPFSRTNAYLEEHGVAPVDWRLPAAASRQWAVAEAGASPRS